MINEVTSCSTYIIFTLVLILQIFQTIQTASFTPFNYLIPPPLNPTKLPLLLPPQTAELQYISNALPSQHKGHNKIEDTHLFRSNHSILSTVETPKFMTKIINWFGFGRNEKVVNLNTHAGTTTRKHSYYHNPPTFSRKDLCNLCNKHPWMPMFPNSIMHDKPSQPLNHLKKSNQQFQLTQPLSNEQHRAVRYPFAQSGLFSTLPVPTFNGSQYQNLIKVQSNAYSSNANFSIKHEGKNIINGNNVIVTQIPSILEDKSKLDFEIIKSHRLTDFVASVEYSAKLIKSPTTDIHSDTTTLPTNHKADSFSSLSRNHHHHEIPNDFTNLFANLASTSQTASRLYFSNASNNSTYHAPKGENDNFPSASAQNATSLKQSLNLSSYSNNLNLNSEHAFYDSFALTKMLANSSEVTTQDTLSVNTAIQKENFDENYIELLETTQKNTYNNSSYSQYRKKSRQENLSTSILGTPVRQKNRNFEEPRPFTKEPSFLDIRIGVQRPKQTATVSSRYATPRSTYTAFDASGQFAGISPPNLSIAQFGITENKNSSKLKMSYMIRNRPRPFELIHDSTLTPWPYDIKQDFYKPQESVLVTVKSENVHPASHNTKYLTKILASNLHELLKREKKIKKNTIKSFDIKKFQRNIDNWTEQEYNSQSRKPSTPTIAGRSKNIPQEYLPTTKMIKLLRLPKTSKIFDKPSDLTFSINNLDTSSNYHHVAIEDHVYPDINQQLLDESNTNRTEFFQNITYKTSSPSTENTSTASGALFRTSVEPWQNTKVNVSPKTHEKVFIVTPQPRMHLKPLNVIHTSKSPPTIKIRSSSINSSRFQSESAVGSRTLHSGYNKTFPLIHPEHTSNAKYATTDLLSKDAVQVIDGKSDMLTNFTTPIEMEINTSSTATLKTINRAKESQNTILWNVSAIPR